MRLKLRVHLGGESGKVGIVGADDDPGVIGTLAMQANEVLAVVGDDARPFSLAKRNTSSSGMPSFDLPASRVVSTHGPNGVVPRPQAEGSFRWNTTARS